MDIKLDHIGILVDDIEKAKEYEVLYMMRMAISL